ncbi:MAG TPA: DUF4920 domain-containing protein [Sandaracinaceae bacterium LLY-WYZ-13_1]|nr:DUF4920 domain-containing protein [Sandaracinaceae bacterium LLY-WYZ-13_1]
MRRGLALALLLVGCQGTGEPSARLGATAASEATRGEPTRGEAREPEPAAADEPAADRFGAALDEGLPLTELAAIVREPARFEGRVVRTEGQIARVCQRMGCWMELREGEDGPAVRVPMAGHRFFLPRDSAGRHAQMQGRVVLRELSAEDRAHLESEGAVATASALSIQATGVVID